MCYFLLETCTIGCVCVCVCVYITIHRLYFYKHACTLISMNTRTQLYEQLRDTEQVDPRDS